MSDGQWHRYGVHIKNGVTDYYIDNKWTYSVPHPSWWHPLRRIRSKRWEQNNPA